VRKPPGVVDHVVSIKIARRTRLHQIQNRFVRRKTQTVRPVHAALDHGHLAACAIDSIDIHREFLLGAVAFVVAEQPERRIGEPDGAVGFHHDVVGRIQAFAFEALGDGSNGAVILGATHAPSAVLAGDESSLTIARVAVGKVGRLAKHADRSSLFFPLHHSVVGNVAPEQIAPIAEPYRPFRPAKTVRNALDRCQVQPIFRKALVDYFDGGIGIALVGLPGGLQRFCVHRRTRLVVGDRVYAEPGYTWTKSTRKGRLRRCGETLYAGAVRTEGSGASSMGRLISAAPAASAMSAYHIHA